MDEEVMTKVLRAVAQAGPEDGRAPRASDRLVDDLGFDSLAIAKLAIALESEFDAPFLLNDWIVGAPRISALTVSSLAEFVAASFAGGA